MFVSNTLRLIVTDDAFEKKTAQETGITNIKSVDCKMKNFWSEWADERDVEVQRM